MDNSWKRSFLKTIVKSLPILNLHLGETEGLLAYKAKKRPVVIVGTRATSLGGIDKEAKPHHEETRIVGCADIRTVERR
jgi:hypothetical protein